MKACVEKKPYTIPLPTGLLSFLECKSATSVLEIGCGYGRTCFFLQKNGLEAAGIDLDRVQVRLASEEMKRQRIRQGIGLVVNDARNLCFPDDSFDVVTLLGVLTLVPKAERQGIMNEALQGSQTIGLRLRRGIWANLGKQCLQEKIQGRYQDHR